MRQDFLCSTSNVTLRNVSRGLKSELETATGMVPLYGAYVEVRSFWQPWQRRFYVPVRYPKTAICRLCLRYMDLYLWLTLKYGEEVADSGEPIGVDRP